MELKDFGKYIRGKSVHKLLHRARKSSLNRIVANGKELDVRLPSERREKCRRRVE